ncbi:MarR family transcriptional regulator [Microlunatus elymi]|uniref:MarR family transcriptional regulator n=1 Tax=Microlunatus elymi TaxID=2596828 RepID=A0A516PZZ5_9ACTN|nr:MarR family transcriptional regulator [Microlunatus elymi]QDP96749.1 MarR family transcriptional regulator [Microlunatus elymi]
MERTQATELLESLVSLSRITRHMAHRDGEQSVSATPMALLHVVQDTDPRLGDLAERLRVKPSVASRAVAALETDGYVKRVADPDDARACRIHLTDAGRAHLRRRQERAVELIARSFADWTDEDAERSVRLLKRLEDSVVRWVGHVEQSVAAGQDPFDTPPDFSPTLPSTAPPNPAPPPGSEAAPAISATTTTSDQTHPRTAWEKTTA